MSRMRRRPARRRSAAALTATVAVFALAATACGPGDDDTDDGKAPGGETGEDEGTSAADRLEGLLDELPIDINIDDWKDGEWANWDRDQWLREAGEYIGVIMEGFWDQDRMDDADDRDKSVDDEEIDEGGDQDPGSDDPADDRGVTDPTPEVVDAVERETPYSDHTPAIGRVFMETPEGPMSCSGAVVEDPDNPGASNLVATAGHCVHEGAEGGWFRQLAFVPSYNDQGQPAVELEDGVGDEASPYGIWWATYVGTTSYWVDNGTEEGGNGAHQDFAVMAVEPEDEGADSLEERVGASYPIDFDAPAVAGLGTTEVSGYPAAPPFDGVHMYACTDDPSRLSLDPDQPGMYRVGCTMTGGSSGGPWLATDDSGAERLVSVTSIGPFDSTWLAGPRLEEDARDVLEDVSSNS